MTDKISIHAPAKGATEVHMSFYSDYEFQSTLPRRGATRPSCSRPSRRCRFQSTLPRRGATRCHAAAIRQKQYFNPRSREGSDAVGN